MLSFNACACRSSDKSTYNLPYCENGSTWNTWVVGWGLVNGETIVNLSNNAAWGVEYTLIITSVYTKS